jgi:hypothetical protein
MDVIPKDVALKLCEEIRAKNRGRWYSFFGMWCWGCYRFSRGNSTRLCFSNNPENRGCAQVNERYENVNR